MRTRLPRLLTLIVAVGLLAAACGDDDDSSAPTTIPQPLVPGAIVEWGQDNGHVENPTFDAAPPSGGDHLGVWLNCGVYDEPVPDGNAVHSLEHGAVWIAYSPELDPNGVAALAGLSNLNPGKIIVSPYPGLDEDIVAVAWGHRFIPQDAADRGLADFVLAYIEAPTAPEPNAPCAGGVDGS